MERSRRHSSPATPRRMILVGMLLVASVDAFTMRKFPQRLAATPPTLTPAEEELLFETTTAVTSSSTTTTTTTNSRRRHQKATSVVDDSDADQAPWEECVQTVNTAPSESAAVQSLQKVRHTLQTGPDLWPQVAQIVPHQVALYDAHLSEGKVAWTFRQVDELVSTLGRSLQSFIVTDGAKNVPIFAENSARWLVTDHALQRAGFVSAVRGAAAPVAELRYIYRHCDAAGTVVLQGPKLLETLLKTKVSTGNETSPLGLSNDTHGPVKTVILINQEKRSREDIESLARLAGVQVLLWTDLVVQPNSEMNTPFPVVQTNDVATIVYTSGTTGNPKGVMLTHANLLHQIHHRLSPSAPYDETEPLPGHTMLSLLPVWHITERTFELWMLTRGCRVCYSTVRHFKKDLALHKPEWLVLVPRVLEKIAGGVQDKFASGSVVARTLVKLFTAVSRARTVHVKRLAGLTVGPNEKPKRLLWSKIVQAALTPLHAVGNKLVWSKVQAGFGGNLRLIISGGSALSGALEEFYETASIPILVGFGLTECSPLLSFRRADTNLVTAGCAGKPCADTTLRIVPPRPEGQEGAPLSAPRKSVPRGEVGVVIGKGPQVMKGYYKNPQATQEAIDEFGWFDTGDLGRLNPATGDLILTGRAKDTIVLSNGENIEPGPIEDAILGESPLVDQIMLTGQDGRSLVAVAVLNPVELGSQGFAQNAAAWQKQQEILNDPLCKTSDGDAASRILVPATEELRSNTALMKQLKADIQKATQGFRQWEQVGDVVITLEPFAMVNGQLTQSYKVKRPAVQERYNDLLAAS